MALWMFYNSVLTSPEPEVGSVTFEELINRLSSIYNSYAFHYDHDAIYKCFDDPEEATYMKKEAKRFNHLETLCDNLLSGDKDYQKCPVCFYQHLKDANEEDSVMKYREKFFDTQEAQQMHLKHGHAPPPTPEEMEDEEVDELKEDGSKIDSATYDEIICTLETSFSNSRADYLHDARRFYWADNEEGVAHMKKEARKYDYLMDLCRRFKYSYKTWQTCPICFYQNFVIVGKERYVAEHHELFHSDEAQQKHLDHGCIPIEELNEEAEEQRLLQ